MDASKGDLTLTGATLTAQNVALQAAQNLVLQSLALHDESASSFSASSSFFGLTAGVSMTGLANFGLTANASRQSAGSQSASINHAQTVVNASGTASLSAGDNAALNGAEVLANTIQAAVGGNLTIASDQDVVIECFLRAIFWRSINPASA